MGSIAYGVLSGDLGVESVNSVLCFGNVSVDPVSVVYGNAEVLGQVKSGLACVSDVSVESTDVSVEVVDLIGGSVDGILNFLDSGSLIVDL